MTNMTPTTVSEKKLTTAIQAAIGAAEDGILGPASAVDLAVAVGAECWPLTVQLFGQPVIVCKDITVLNPGKGTKHYANSLSGSFSFQKQPCSILVSDGKVLWQTACHAWLGQPESVLYRLENGKFGMKRCLSAEELPKGVRWAVGGMGLGKTYAPKTEGFSGQYADVLRDTNHTVLGVKKDMIYLVYAKSKTAAQVNALVTEDLKLELAIMLDGGHVASINGAEHFAKINTAQNQYYLIQALEERSEA